MVVSMEIVLSLYFYFTEHKTERQEQNSAEEDRAKPEGPGGLIQGRGYHRDRAEHRVLTVWCQRH